MATLATKSNNTDPFKFVINVGTPQNQQITFKLTVSDGAYSANYFFDVKVNVDYINVKINDVFTTMTSAGKIGYNQDQQAEGLGFKYNNVPLLYEAGLMVGSSPNAVSDCIRGVNGTNADADFQTLVTIHEVIPHVTSEFDLNGKFNDVPASPTQNMEITHNTYAWSTPGNTKYVIVEYFIKNKGTALLDNLYAGICADWDIDATTYDKNKSDYDPVSKMGYSWSTNTNGLYAGIKLLTNTAPPVFNGIDNLTGGNGGVDVVTNGFETTDKYTALSVNRLQAGNTATTGNDVLNVMSSGPFTLNPGDTAKVAFALIAGNNLTDIQLSADSAQFHYDGTYTGFGIKSEQDTRSRIQVFPVPATNQLTLILPHLKEEGNLSLCNMLGQIIQQWSVGAGSTIIKSDVSPLAAGTYFYQLKSSGNLFQGKFIITR